MAISARIEKLRKESLNAFPHISTERAKIETDFYKENYGKYSIPVFRALNFKNLCTNKDIYIGDGELIVGERGADPKCIPTFPELTCHSVQDLEILRTRKMTSYRVPDKDIQLYKDEIIPYWHGRTLKDRIFSNVPKEWDRAYKAGLFTEFMAQRAPGHTTLDSKIYKKGMLDFKREILDSLLKLDYLNDPNAAIKAEELKGMSISCDAVAILANRHADLAEKMAEEISSGKRKNELLKITSNCRWVPANAPRDLWEALQMYWFIHLGTVIELNGWDAMNPGHLDQHLTPFYEKGIADGMLTREKAKELIECFWIKFNNQPAPPKIGITAKESSTYNDFTNINLGGLKKDGSSGVSEVSYLILEVVNNIHLLQPQCNIQVSAKTPNRFLKAAVRLIRKGYGYPSVFNADEVVMEQIRVGKSIEDAREGGCSGCIETGCFGKEAYILTGYLNLPKILEVTLNNGIDPIGGEKVGIETGNPRRFKTFDDLYDAFVKQLNYIVDLKIRTNNYIEKMYATYAPATFLSVLISDCINNGRDYYDGGPRYNTNYIQCVGIGTFTDSLSAIKKHVFEDKTITMDDLLNALRKNFKGEETLRLILLNKTPFYGNDDDYADSIMKKVFASAFDAIDGKPNTKGAVYHLDMLSTTCHIYFGQILGASANGRFAGLPESDGTTPSQGADKHGPTGVIKSLGKMDQVKSGGTLLNQKFLPSVLESEDGIGKVIDLIRSYFKLGGHHIQFNIVDAKTLRDAQAHPEDYRELLVRVAGYSDYFVDLDNAHQEEIISRTEQTGF